MPRKVRTIGETKRKVLAIIYDNEIHGTPSYGYNIWLTLEKKFHSYLDDRDLRNVYHHLKDLNKAGLVEKGANQLSNNAPGRQLYTLTQKGKEWKPKFKRYLQILEGAT